MLTIFGWIGDPTSTENRTWVDSDLGEANSRNSKHGIEPRDRKEEMGKEKEKKKKKHKKKHKKDHRKSKDAHYGNEEEQDEQHSNNNNDDDDDNEEEEFMEEKDGDNKEKIIDENANREKPKVKREDQGDLDSGNGKDRLEASSKIDVKTIKVKAEKQVDDDTLHEFKPGQKKETPPPGAGIRVFYESLYK